ncbi:MAG: pyruvate/oxaloacetate carboxyltransferase [Planctomycetota bacterium]|nr:pyruvate/oxaloacetate carboxyltransferase [Planctomycetota bacterium]
MTKKIQIMETALRDAHQSLFATRMLTEDMLPILEKMDSVGYYSLEAWGGATFDVCMRYLLEDPWQRLRTIRKHVKKTRLQMLLRGQNVVGYRHYADDVLRKFIEKAKANGIDVFRIFDALNDPRNLELAMKTAKKCGGVVEGAISYTTSPVHNVEAFVKFAGQLKDMGSDVICVKDMAGLLSPMDAFDLVKALKEQVKLPIHLHCHSASGMAPMSYLAACEAGVDILDTAVSPLSGGTSQPATEAIVGALKGSSFDTGLDIALLAEIGDYFETIKERYCQLIDPLAFRVDSRLFIHQIPGGMMSNLISQLKEQNAMDKFHEVLEETGRVRKDMGYPPLVTPTSQIVGTQAVLNVLSKSRYKVVSKQTKDYVRGLYGKSPAPIPADIVKACVGNDKLITSRPADDLSPELEKARADLAGVVESDEDVLSYVLFPQVALEFFKARKQGRGPVRACVPPPEKPAPVNTKVMHEAHASLTPSGGGYDVLLGDRSFTVGVQRGRPANGATPLTLVIDGQTISVLVKPADKKPSGQTATATAAPAQPVARPLQTIPPAGPAAAPTPAPAAAPVATAAPATHAPARETRKMSEGAPPRGAVCAPMPGKIVSVSVKPGERVVKGQRLFILEAMKMENEIDAPFAGNVEAVNAQPGMTVSNTNQPLIVIKPD